MINSIVFLFGFISFVRMIFIRRKGTTHEQRQAKYLFQIYIILLLILASLLSEDIMKVFFNITKLLEGIK